MAEDPLRVPRTLPPQLAGCRLMLVGEALGPGTQRLSGLPYVQPDGSMRPAGRALDAFLARFGYTIRPNGSGQYAYSTDLVRCVPLRSREREKVRPPTRREAANCLPWLEEEISLARPRVVILLGVHAVRAFFRAYLGRRVQRLAEVVGGPHMAKVGAVEVAVFAVHHPSPRASRPERDDVYARVGGEIAQLLATSSVRDGPSAGSGLRPAQNRGGVKQDSPGTQVLRVSSAGGSRKPPAPGSLTSEARGGLHVA